MGQQFWDSVILLAMLFNPFLMCAYLHEVMSALSLRTFAGVLLRAFAISGLAFCAFAVAGDQVFSRGLQVRFAAFLVFGGIVFLIIAIRSMTLGTQMIAVLRGPPEHLAGSLAMPFMIGPGTVSASILIGKRHAAPLAFLAILVALVTSCVFLLMMKAVFDIIRKRSERLLERYMDIFGRIAAILIGTIAVDMIMRGLDLWLIERL